MPSGSLGAQPQLWLNAVLIGPDGSHLWESGHLDTNGDLCDYHWARTAAKGEEVYPFIWPPYDIFPHESLY